MLLKTLWLIVILATLADSQFTIDYDEDTFRMDGEPFRYVSGSVHYFRMPRQYWRDRLRKMKAAGLNAVSTIVEWSQHEPEPGQYNFSGDLNITEFITTAQEEGLYVILRAGPYICAERTMGGFPYWLLRENPDIKLRVNDPSYKTYSERWLDVILPRIAPQLFGNGGPIITVQVENEYGFYGSCDHDYTAWLAGVFKKYIGENAILFTTDGSGYDSLSCGKIPGVYATIDFGPGTNVTEVYLNQKVVEPKGPFVNSEFYPGWLTHWGESWATRSTDDILKTLKEILDMNGNVNFYMFYGGTNFGFTAGANFGPYTSHITSYDYDAPISEAGDLTPKYLAIREFLLNYLSLNTTTLPENSPKGDYGILTLKNTATLTSSGMKALIGRTVPTMYPKSFEDISQDEGFVFYEYISEWTGQGVPLELDARDLATIYINDNYVGNLSRQQETTKINVDVKQGDKIGVLVENGGRINFGDRNNDRKGILSNVTLNGQVLPNWNMTAFNFKEFAERLQLCSSLGTACKDGPGFSIYTGVFTSEGLSNIEYEGQRFPPDAFIDARNLTKGLIFVNDFNLGRYWSTRGPQYSLYVPGVYLKVPPQVNTVVLIDENINDESISISFSPTPIIGDPIGK